MSQSSKVQIPRGLPAGMLKLGIDQCITFPKAFLWASFFETGYYGLRFAKAYKKLTWINKVKNDFTVCYTVPKVQ